jgi:hypothetical protein
LYAHDELDVGDRPFGFVVILDDVYASGLDLRLALQPRACRIRPPTSRQPGSTDAVMDPVPIVVRALIMLIRTADAP